MIIEFLGDLLSKIEFWSLTTLGVGTSTILATIWTRRSNLALKKSNVNTDDLTKELKTLKAADVNNTKEIQSLRRKFPLY